MIADGPKRIAIILPSYNDPRIADAIASVRRFDDIDAVKLVIIDGGSNAAVVEILRNAARPDDILISEPDGGIFDALNKGLERVDTEFIGWLGSDDLFTGQIKASDVIAALDNHDIYVTGLAMFRDDEVRRIFDARIVEFGMVHMGLHNPHYSTFGRTSALKAHRFPLTHKGSDIEYFLDVFADKPRVKTSSKIGVAMREGGYSNQSYRRILDINRGLYDVYRDRVGAIGAFFALILKLSWKVGSGISARFQGKTVSDLMVG